MDPLLYWLFLSSCCSNDNWPFFGSGPGCFGPDGGHGCGGAPWGSCWPDSCGGGFCGGPGGPGGKPGFGPGGPGGPSGPGGPGGPGCETSCGFPFWALGPRGYCNFNFGFFDNFIGCPNKFRHR